MSYIYIYLYYVAWRGGRVVRLGARDRLLGASYIYIYIYIYREREGYIYIYMQNTHIHIYIYTHIHTCATGRGGEGRADRLDAGALGLLDPGLVLGALLLVLALAVFS